MKQNYSVTGVLQCAVLLLVLINSAQSACRPGDWIEYKGNCYWWTPWTQNWFYSEMDCKANRGVLAIIRSREENEFLLKLTQCSHNLWIGLVNYLPSMKHSPSGYLWWDLSTSLSFHALNLTNANYHDCVYSDSNGTWHNTYCQNQYRFVCKSPTVQDSSNEQHSDILHKSNEIAEIPAAPANETEQYYNGTLAPTATPSPSRCPEGWQQLDNNCYFYSANKTNYFNAQMSCEAMGATVTSVLSRREHLLLTVALGCYSQSWIGLEKARPCYKRPGVDHCWVWMDRSPVNYLAWADSSQTVDRRDAECVIIEGQWKVTNCYNQFGYVCKRPVS